MHKLSSYFGAALLAGALCTLGACKSREDAQLEWARAALERNPQVKVLAVDTDQHSIKLRIVATGEETMVAAGELAAIPIADLVSLSNSARQAASPIRSASASSTNSSIAPDTSTPEPIARTASSREEPSPPVETVNAVPPTTASPAGATTTSEPLAAYKVEREAGRVRVNGPGVSIESSSQAPDPRTQARTYDDPIVCDGHRFMHVDGKRISVDGDGIVARGGCELHITNTTVDASGTGITVLDATVHITNSDIRGSDSSLTTSSAAHVYLRNTKFNGLARRNPQAEIRELGGNTWR